MKSIQLESKQYKIIKNILSDLDVNVFVFGSRIKGSARKLSDLDLCLMNPYSKQTVRKLQDAFEESDLPFKVDVVVWSKLTDSFKKQIEKDLVSFEELGLGFKSVGEI